MTWWLAIFILSLVLEGNASQSNLKESGWIGLKFFPTTHRVKRVFENSPAEKAGIRAGDIVLEVDGKYHGDIAGNAGETAHIKIKRGAEILEIKVMRVPHKQIKDAKKWLYLKEEATQTDSVNVDTTD